MPSAARQDYITAMKRFHSGEDTPYNGSVVYSCTDCGALVDQANLVTHDVWHKNLLNEVVELQKNRALPIIFTDR